MTVLTCALLLFLAEAPPEPFCGVDLRDLSRAQPPSNRKMAEELQRIRREASPFSSTFLNQEQLPLLRQALAQAQDSREQGQTLMRIASAALNVGENQAAIDALDKIESLVEGTKPDPKFLRFIRSMRGVAWLRVGELENCVTNHTVLSCLAPIEPGGVHKLERGSRHALAEFASVLEEEPWDLRARWLYNIAAMTLGEWPDQVNPDWAVPEALFASEYPMKRFPDIAAKLGLDVNDRAGGVVADDFDNDGHLDLMVSAWGLDSPLKFFRNNGNGSFSERGGQAGLAGLTGALNMIQADYNNDGFLDVLLLRGGWLGVAGHYPSSLLRNNRDGTFTDVTEAAGLLRYRPTQTAVWFDYNGDGWIDLFIGNESWENDPNPCELYRNNGDGTFQDMARESGVNVVAVVKGVSAGDFNNDGRPDLYLSLRARDNILFRNDGGGKFTDVARSAGVTEPVYSFPTWFFDYDNDGWEDLFVADYGVNHVGDVAADFLRLPSKGAKARLYRNRGDGGFDDVTERVSLHKVMLAMGCNFGDLDNDGWLDFYLGTGDPDLATVIPNRMFRNAGGKTFQDVTTAGGFGHLQKGHGVAFADLDNDGDQDVFAVMGGAYESDVYRRALFENPGHGRSWVKLKLEGVKSNRAAIGARIKAVFEDEGRTRTIYKTVNSGGSFGANPLRQELGLASAKRVEKLEVRWPATGKTQVFTNLAVNTTFYLKEGASRLEEVALKRLAWKDGPPAKHHH